MSVTPMPAADKADAEPAKGSKKKLVMIAVVLLVVAGAGYWFFLKPAAAEPPPEPGEVLVLDPIQINLAGGHYLKLGLGLQLTKNVHEEPDGSKALDAAIKLYSGKPLSEVNGAEGREHLKKELVEMVEERYEHDVMGVYLRDYVTQ